jgi:hypothetical protein
VSDNVATLDATSSSNGTKQVLRLTTPATLWGGQALQQEGAATLLNDFVFKAARETCYRAGYETFFLHPRLRTTMARSKLLRSRRESSLSDTSARSVIYGRSAMG